MREIRFRAREVNSVRWVYGYLLVTPGGTFILKAGHPLQNGDFYVPQMYWSQVDPSTVGQFTGQKDKNGVDLYESDIVRQEYRFTGDYPEVSLAGHHVGEVVIIPSKGVCMKRPWHYPNPEETDEKPWRLQGHKPIVRYRCERIGNIHDNAVFLINGE